MNALMNLPSIWGAKASTSTPSRARNSRASSRDKCGSVRPQPAQILRLLTYCSTHFLRGPGDAAYPQQHALADLGQHFAASHYVGYGQSPSGLQQTKASKSTRSLSAERLITQFEMMTFTELSGSGCARSPPSGTRHYSARLLFVLVRQGQHFIRHVETVRLAGRPTRFADSKRLCHRRSPGRGHLSRIQVRQRRWIPAPQRSEHGLRREFDLPGKNHRDWR